MKLYLGFTDRCYLRSVILASSLLLSLQEKLTLPASVVSLVQRHPNPPIYKPGGVYTEDRRFFNRGVTSLGHRAKGGVCTALVPLPSKLVRSVAKSPL